MDFLTHHLFHPVLACRWHHFWKITCNALNPADVIWILYRAIVEKFCVSLERRQLSGTPEFSPVQCDGFGIGKVEESLPAPMINLVSLHAEGLCDLFNHFLYLLLDPLSQVVRVVGIISTMTPKGLISVNPKRSSPIKAPY